MNEENEKFLQDNLKYLGFGDKFNENLKEAMQSGDEEFSLKGKTEYPQPTKQEGKNPETDTVTYDIKFKKGKESDMYFLNGYKATLEKPGHEESASQYFYVNKGKGVTAKESFNLLSGRSVNKDVINKEGEKVNLWMKLDFNNKKDDNFEMKTFSKNYGFDLSDAIDKSSIKGLDKPENKERLIQSLERGNLHSVNFEHKGAEVKGFVSAEPQFKKLNFFHDNLKPVYSENKSNKASVENAPDQDEKKPMMKSKKLA